MPDELIEFVSEDVDFTLPNQEPVAAWLTTIIQNHPFQLQNLTYIFCSDEYLLEINQEYLDHDTYTDIITFNNADEPEIIESDIFISIDRVKENAANLNIPFLDELHRVMAHGVLHLLGYDDKSPELKQLMRTAEDNCLSLRKF
ncbi:endoribonuclease YbeY [Adhaeribacter aerolatus]|uniref:Endoribonuclease YbeY n=1 Tax=Adhaeribacter aerolatus TaxID=670289 RepID=A0A512AX67_9BACT|nr:rRNA maturation RNase YbeY [Adhaeribacter aerolatus]GEO04311.1 endoribonuclease YbeY [Adhaeribacter aerolatus]